MKDNNNTLSPPTPFEVKVVHQLKHQPEANDFIIAVSVEIFRQEECFPLQEIYFSSTVDHFIWEDEDCPEKVELYECLVDAGINETEAQDMLNDLITYVARETLLLEDDYNGVFTLAAEVTLLSEPVQFDITGSEKNQLFQDLTTKTREQLNPELVEVYYVGSEQTQFQGSFRSVKEPKLETVELNHSGSERSQLGEPIKKREKPRRRLKPEPKIRKAVYKIGPDGVSLVKVH